MTPKQDGEYKCNSEEMAYLKVQAQYHLGSTAAGWVFAHSCLQKSLVLVLSLIEVV